MEKRTISFSPPDISEREAAEVVEALKSGWITTGPRTKHLERRLAAFIETGRADLDTEQQPSRWSKRVACLSSATAAEEMCFRLLGIKEGDEVIVPAYTYTASASVACTLKNVTSIGSEAFKDCKKLKTVTINAAKLKTVGKDAFKNIQKKATFKCPKKQKDAYRKLIKSNAPKNAKFE